MGYLGGKGNCSSHIIGAMPIHRVYIETHLGAGAVMRTKRPAERQIGIDLDPEVIASWRRRDAPCELVIGDAAQFLANYPFKGDEVVYCDPPYPHESRASRTRYRHEYDEGQHAALLGLLRTLNCRILISGQPTELYCEMLSDWRCTRFEAPARRGAREEMLWANFPQPDHLHDPLKAVGGFRDRERVKRRQATMYRKVDQMTQLERTLFLAWLAESYPEEMARHELALR